MDYDIEISPVEGTKGEKYNFKLCVNGQCIVDTVDKEFLRHLIGKADNQII